MKTTNGQLTGKIPATAGELVEIIKANGSSANLQGMRRFGIDPRNGFGCSMPFLRSLAKQVEKSHQLALDLWDTEIHDARILASLLEIPEEVTLAQIEKWVQDFYSWDICDQVIGNVFRKVPDFVDCIPGLCQSESEFVRRAGFAGMATLAVHKKKWGPEAFEVWFPLLKSGCFDERNFVKKAISWALRQIGKRNTDLKGRVLDQLESWENEGLNRAGRWIVSDVRRELERH